MSFYSNHMIQGLFSSWDVVFSWIKMSGPWIRSSSYNNTIFQKQANTWAVFWATVCITLPCPDWIITGVKEWSHWILEVKFWNAMRLSRWLSEFKWVVPIFCLSHEYSIAMLFNILQMNWVLGRVSVTGLYLQLVSTKTSARQLCDTGLGFIFKYSSSTKLYLSCCWWPIPATFLLSIFFI